MTTVAPKNMADVIAGITSVRNAMRAQHETDKATGELTPDGLKSRHAGWARERQWERKIDEAQARATRVIDARRTKLDKLRAEVTEPSKDLQVRQLGESIFSRRRHVVDALLEKPGASGLSEFIANASPEERPMLVGHIRDHALINPGFASTLNSIVDAAIDALDPAIATASEALDVAEQSAEIVRVQADDARAVLADPGHATPAYVEAWSSGHAVEAAAQISV